MYDVLYTLRLFVHTCHQPAGTGELPMFEADNDREMGPMQVRHKFVRSIAAIYFFVDCDCL
jgi:hypothetical protein